MNKIIDVKFKPEDADLYSIIYKLVQDTSLDEVEAILWEVENDLMNEFNEY